MVYLSAVRALHVTEGQPKPMDEARIKLTLKEIEKHSTEPQRKLAITYEILTKFHRILNVGAGAKFNEIMLWTAMTLAHFGCMHTS